MPRRAARPDEGLAAWLENEGIVTTDAGPGAIADVARVRELLIEAAHEGRSVSYSELLGALGHRFTRPKMRAVCKTLDAIDSAAKDAGEPELAVLVVRETDRLPGQGWWVGSGERYGCQGAWEGAPARRLVDDLQARAFAYWRARRVQ